MSAASSRVVAALDRVYLPHLDHVREVLIDLDLSPAFVASLLARRSGLTVSTDDVRAWRTEALIAAANPGNTRTLHMIGRHS